MRAEELAAADRVLFVHAHPDDETLATGGLIARLAPIRQVFVLTATRGERGEIADPALRELPDLAAHRETELATALARLGGTGGIHHAFLGTPPARAAGLAPRRYLDSGMAWGGDGLAEPAPEAGPDALTQSDPGEQLADLLAYCRRIRPSSIVSYGPLGGYGHPDHLRARDLARRAADLVQVPYVAAISDIEREQLSQGERADLFGLDGSAFAGQVRDALRAHASQLTVVAGPGSGSGGPGGAQCGHGEAGFDPAAGGIVIRHSGGQIEERAALEYYLPA